MASPFLANLALGYVKQQQTDRKAALDRQYTEESERRKMELDVEQQKRLNGLAFESMMQKEVVSRGMNQQANARIAEQYGKIASTSTDPAVRKQAQKWASVYSGAGDLPEEAVQTFGKNLSPEKAEQMSVQEMEFTRKQRNEALLEEKLVELTQLDMTALEKDPKLRQRTFLSLAKGLDSDYVAIAQKHFEAFFPTPVSQKMPDYLKNADVQYRTMYSKYMSQRAAVVQGKAEAEDLVVLEGQLNELATSLNDWSKENSVPQQYIMFVDDDQNPETPAKAIAPEKKELLEATRYVPGGGQSPTIGTQKISWQARADELRKQFPNASTDDVLKQLQAEGLIEGTP